MNIPDMRLTKAKRTNPSSMKNLRLDIRMAANRNINITMHIVMNTTVSAKNTMPLELKLVILKSDFDWKHKDRREIKRGGDGTI